MAKYKKRSPEEIKGEMESYNQKIITLGQTFEDDPTEMADYFAFSSKFYRYSPRNQQLIYHQNEHASFVGSFMAYKEKGYCVEKGQKGMKVFVPVKCSYFYREGENTSTRLADATAKEKALIKQGVIEVKSGLRFKLGSVFDISQTDCPVEDYPKFIKFGENSKPHAELYEKLKGYCENQGFKVAETSLRSIGLRGQYCPKTKEIDLNHKLQDTQKLGTFLHEMSHGFLDHKRKAEDNHITGLIKEFEADGLAIMFMSHFGFDITDGTKSHLANQYNEFNQAIKGLDDSEKEIYSLNDSFKKINDLFKEHIEPMEDYLEKSVQVIDTEIEDEWENEM